MNGANYLRFGLLQFDSRSQGRYDFAAICWKR